jgi:hypothetical protein
MEKYVVALFVLVLLVTGGLYVLMAKGKKVMPVQPSAAQVSTYATSTFSIKYPPDYTTNESYAYDQFGPKKLIHGVKFTISGAMATGTNLSSYDTGISVESLPRARNCTGDIYISANVKATTFATASTTYSVATSSGAAAGNLYEEQVFAIKDSKPCTAVRYYIHSMNIGNYPTGTVREFDRAALISAFDKIRNSLTFGAVSLPVAPTTTP